MRSLRVLIGVMVGSLLAGALAGVLAAGPAAGQTKPRTIAKAKNACKLLTSQEITAVFDDAPLDPGPQKVELPKGGLTNFSQCFWFDEKGDASVTRLMARTSLALGINGEQAKRLTKPVPNSNGRAIAREELPGVGSKGVIEVNENRTSATVGALKGDNFYIVTVGYVGAGEFTPITDVDILTLARAAAKRV
jgi:hypothetical protein